jgi:hypothetical protein
MTTIIECTEGHYEVHNTCPSKGCSAPRSTRTVSLCPYFRLAVHRSSVHRSSDPPTVSATGALSCAPFLYQL